jgi:hypothetical protein
MRLNIVYKAVAPEPPYECELVDIDTAAVPFMLYGIWLKAQKYFWADNDSWRTGRWLLNKQGASLLMPCGNDIINAVDRLYNLVDARLVGNYREVTGTGTEADPFVYDPPIEQAPGFFDPTEASIAWYSGINLSAWQNLLNGEHSGDWNDNYKLKAQLQELIDQDAADDVDIATLIAFAEASGISLEALLLLLA